MSNLFRMIDVDEERIITNDKYINYVTLTHTLSGYSVGGPCHSFTLKDEYGLRNQLEDFVNKYYYGED